MSNSGGSGSISGCKFSGNSAGSTGGGGISVYAGALTIANSTIAGNSSAGAGGGLLVYLGNGFESATATLTNCTVSGNSAVAGGGISNLGTLSVANSNISKNEALGNAAGGGFGGGIEDDSSGALTVSGSTFDANEAIAVGPNDPIVSPSYVFASGGAIDLNLASTGSATITSSRFIGNEAKGGSAGASAGGGAISNSSNVGATLTVTDCTLTDNAAIGAAGGDGTTNYGSGQGGGINSIGTLTVRDSTLTDNLAQGCASGSGCRPLAVGLEQQCDRRRRHLLPRPRRRPRAHCRQHAQRQSGGRRLRAGAGPRRRRRHLPGPRSFRPRDRLYGRQQRGSAAGPAARAWQAPTA